MSILHPEGGRGLSQAEGSRRARHSPKGEPQVPRPEVREGTMHLKTV